MKVYKNIYWYLKSGYNPINIRNILGKNDYKKIKKIVDNLGNYNLEIGVEDVNDISVEGFYRDIYIPFISKKQFPNIQNIPEKIKYGISSGKKYYMGYIKHSRVLIGGIVFFEFINSNGIKKIGASFRGIKDQDKFDFSLGNLLEYLFFSYGLQINATLFSKGKSTNCSGCGSSIGVAIHKLQQKFLPYLGKNNIETVEIDESLINSETLIFSDIDNDNKFTKAILFTNKNINDIQKSYSIIEKRGFILDTRNITY